MPETNSPDASTTKVDAPEAVRLRVDVYDALAHAKGYRTVESQANWHGMNRDNLFRLRSGKRQPMASTAMRMAADLGVAVEVIWERVA